MEAMMWIGGTCVVLCILLAVWCAARAGSHADKLIEDYFNKRRGTKEDT